MSGFESFARERDRERVTRRDAKGASVTVRRGSAAIDCDAGTLHASNATNASPNADATKRRKIATSAPVAPLDRFPSFPGPATARSAEAARRRADAAKAFAETSNERTGWRRFFWGAGVKAARGAVDEDVGEIAEVQPVREQVALGEVSDVDASSKNGGPAGRGEGATAAAVGAEFARAASAVGEKLRVQSVSVKSWLDEGAEFVSGWDDDAYDGASEKTTRKNDARDAEPNPSPRDSSADAESASDAR